MSSQQSLFSLFVRYTRPFLARSLFLVVLVVVGVGLRLAGPQLVRVVLDGAAAGRPFGALTFAASAFLGVAVASVLIAGAVTHASADLGWRATNQLRRDLLDAALARPLSFHEARTPGELIERVDTDPAGLSRFLTGFVVAAVTNVLMLVGALVVLYRQRWWLGVGLAAFAVVMVIVLARLRSVAAPRYRASRNATTLQMSFVSDRLRGADDIRATGAVDYVMPRFLETSFGAYRAARRARVTGDALGSAGSSLLKIGTLGALAGGIYLYRRGEATVGTVYLIVQYSGMLSAPLNGVSGQADDFQRAKAAAERVRETIGAEVSGSAAETRPLPAGPLDVEFSEVWFSYGEGPPVLRDITFRLAAGEVTAITGRTGAGKSTLARLLLGLATPNRGAVRVGGVDLAHARDIPSRVALVPQQVQLFNATLRDNLTLFDRSVADQRLLSVIEDLELTAWFHRLPKELDTMIDPRGSDGVGMSGGEAQLIAMARVFLSDPGLVILDEAASRLDPLTERALHAAMTRLVSGRTALVIAHRPSTFRRADALLVLEAGEIIEQGRLSDLERDPTSRFVHLVRSEDEL